MQTKILWVSLLLVILSRPAEADSTSPKEIYRWKGALGAGKVVRVRNLNGAIEVKPSRDGQVTVVAEVRARRSDPSMVKVIQKKGAGGITFCAAFPAGSFRCEADGTYEHGAGHQGDWDVRFLVELPRGVKLDASTVNGAISADTQGPVEARTVNGSVKASGAGPVRARTVNGSISLRVTDGGAEAETTNGGIEVTFARRLAGAARFETVNGSIEVEAPQGLDADVEASARNGAIMVGAHKGRGELKTRVGKGGARLLARTLNGSIKIAQ